MTLSTPQSTEISKDQIDLILRFSRRGLIVLLLTFLWLGATVVGMAFWPNSLLARWPGVVPWLFPVVMVLAMFALRMPLRGRWPSRSHKLKLILQDEFRRSNLARAQRAAFAVVVAAQVPLGLLVLHLPARQAVIGMAGTTVSLGLVTLTALFLIFDRE
jgi:hypothetical protein